MNPNIETMRRYISLVESLPPDTSGFRELLHPEFEQTELPNILNSRGQKSDLADCMRRLASAGKILTGQRYEITEILDSGDRLAAEARWEGTMAMDAGPLRKGQVVRAAFCMIFEFRDGRIYRQRNYDCFEPLI